MRFQERSLTLAARIGAAAVRERTVSPLVIVETHPVQYHAPVYRAVENTYDIPVETIYGSDFSVAGYYDKEFRSSFAWDEDLLRNSTYTFLSKVAEGGAGSVEQVSAKGLGNALARTAAGAVMLTGYQPSFHLAAFFQAWRRGFPILFRAETTDHANTRDRWKASVRDRALRGLYSRCERVLPIGSRSYEHYRRLGVAADKMVFSPYCVDITPFRCDEDARAALRSEMRSSLQVTEGDIVIMFSGKLSRRKGVHVLVDAVKRLPDKTGKRIVLLFVGDGEEKQFLRDGCDRAPAVRAFFAGFQNQRLLSPYYHAADLLALPSVTAETWGLVVNEGLHHGVPCIVSDAVGSASDLIDCGITGEIAEAGSAASLEAAILRALPLVKKEDVRAKCRDKVGNFSVDAAAAGIATAYRSVANRHGARC
jgi:glycosyltransferase involved in cell wall biosynthesis